jgi:DNA mismatch repair protein MutL
MSIIQVLPDHIANQIAAGEVIQRPASVVKELLENAVDAGASQIYLLVKDAGKTLIQVVDNGKGMDPSDAEKCFLRHATSKLSSAKDLFNLQTKGFRGEALASIAAIAHVTLKTKQPDQETGLKIEVEGNQIQHKEAVLCDVGASFEVKNLFYNVPARRNFLKSDQIELGHIQNEFERVALAHPEIGFYFLHNNQEILTLPAGNLRMRVAAVLGRNSNENLVPIEETTDIVTVSGYVGKPDLAKKTRGEQYLFVNQRYFKEPYFHHAITKAFEGMISDKHYASYCIFLSVDPSKIDVNIHPTKTEIKFEEDRFIYSILLSSVRQALGKYNIFPTLDFEQDTAFDVPLEVRKTEPVEPQIVVNPSYNPFESTSQPSSASKSTSSAYSAGIQNAGFEKQNLDASAWQNFYQIDEKPAEAQQAFFSEPESKPNYLIHDKFVLSPTKSGFLLIDIKRAKNRILFDQMMGQFVAQPLSSQQLLFPIERPVSGAAKTSWAAHSSLWKQLGFEYELQADTLLLHGVPSILTEQHLELCIDQLTDDASYRDLDGGDVAHFLVSQLAYYAAKNFRIQYQEEAAQLIEDLFQCEQHSHTPSGKTIMSTLTFDEISKKF